MKKEKSKTIIPIAAGKGGVGKTFITANLAIALAEMGYSTIVADLDLGGANLHSYLGLPNRFAGVGDFLKARSGELEDLLVPMENSTLKFLPGDGRTPFMANIPYAQKRRLISHIQRLPAEYILLDLGAGTSFNTLDFFRISRNGLLIITPEYPSIMSMLSFIKHFLLRVLERYFIREQEILEILRATYKLSMEEEQTIMEVLIQQVGAIDKRAGEKISKLLNAYRPRIVFNLGEHPDDIGLSDQINKSLWKVLSLKADYFGFIFKDPAVLQSVKNRTALLCSDRESAAGRDLKLIVQRIVKYWDRPVENSAQLLYRTTLEIQQEREGHTEDFR